MSNTIKAQFGIILVAIAAIGREFLGGEPVETGNPVESPTEQPKKTRGRPPGSTNTAPAETTKEVVVNAPETVKDAPGGKSLEELQKLIEPFVKGLDGISPCGDEVKRLIMKHGGTRLADLPAASHAAFEKDLDALRY